MVQDILQELQGQIRTWLQDNGVSEPVVLLERAVTAEFGEYSTNVAMRYAKTLGKSPFEIAQQLATFLTEQATTSLSHAAAVKPGFVNIYLTAAAKVQHVSSIHALGTNFGNNNIHTGEKWVVEHTSPNPNKAMHLGHLLNNLIGMGIVRLLKASGAEVVSDAVYNNRGIAIAKAMYGYLAHMKKEADLPTDAAYWVEHQEQWFTPAEKDIRPDLFVTECYRLGELDFSANPEVEAVVRQMVVDWEAGDTATWKLWEQALHYAYQGIDLTLSRLGSYWDNVWYEHEHYQKGKDYVTEGVKKGIFTTLADGAVLTNIEPDYGISDTILLKKDGTSLYITQDLALTDEKKKKYQADKLVWVVGSEQTLAFRQLFATCEQLGIGKVEDFTHIPYGYVGLKDETGAFKKMSSREGTAVFADDVIDIVKARISARFEADEKHDEPIREVLSEKLAIAAVKFAFLKSDSNQDVSFDIEQSVDVQGDSGMYVMYTFVRTQSILRKAARVVPVDFIVPAVLGEEASLVRTLLYFEAVVQKSVTDLSVHHVSQYLLELSSEFNSWYAKETILDGTDQEAYKIVLVDAVAVTLQNGLSLLGIDTVDQM
jgi:arginyl-tRNA synthetase